MNHLLYEYSLCTALALMLFFGFYFILAQTPDKSIFNNYLRSRRTMGAALLVLSANYAVHLFCGIRFTNHNAAILMNLSTYFLCYWLFSSALTSLLDRFYITRRRLIQHITLWCLFTILSGCVLFYLLWNHTKLCTAMHGDMAVRLWHPAGTPLNSGIPACCQIFRRHTFRRYRRVHTLAFHLYILGGHFRCRLRTAYIPARPVYFHMDSFVHSFLYIPVSFIYELPVVL